MDFLYKKPLKTVWPDCKAATKFEKSLNPMVNLKYCMTLKFEWTKSRSQKWQQNFRTSTEKKLKRKGLPTCNIL